MSLLWHGIVPVMRLAIYPVPSTKWRSIQSRRKREDLAERDAVGSEENFPRLSEEMSERVAITTDGKKYWVNKALSEIFGYAREELIGKGSRFPHC